MTDSLGVPKLDVEATALENGYSKEQAATLKGWKEKDLIRFFSEDVIRPDGKKPVLVWQGGYRSGSKVS